MGPLLPGAEHAPPCDPTPMPCSAVGTGANTRCADYVEYMLDKEQGRGGGDCRDGALYRTLKYRHWITSSVNCAPPPTGMARC